MAKKNALEEIFGTPQMSTMEDQQELPVWLSQAAPEKIEVTPEVEAEDATDESAPPMTWQNMLGKALVGAVPLALGAALGGGRGAGAGATAGANAINTLTEQEQKNFKAKQDRDLKKQQIAATTALKNAEMATAERRHRETVGIKGEEFAQNQKNKEREFSLKERELLMKAAEEAARKANPEIKPDQWKSAGFAIAAENAEKDFKSLGKYIPPSGTLFIPEQAKSEQLKKFEDVKRRFVTASLRPQSGAAITKEEQELEEAKYFALPGDSAEVIRSKELARAQRIEDLKAQAGPAYAMTPRAVLPPEDKKPPSQTVGNIPGVDQAQASSQEIAAAKAWLEDPKSKNDPAKYEIIQRRYNMMTGGQ